MQEELFHVIHSVGYSRDIVYAQCLVGYVALCRGDWQRAMSAFRATEPIYLSYCDSRSSPPALPVAGDTVDFIYEIDLDIPQVCAFAQVILSYQAVKTDGGGCACIHLVIGYFRHF